MMRFRQSAQNSASNFVITGLVASLILVGCSSANHKVTPIAPVKVDPWVLEWRDPNVATPAWISNGLVGFRIDRDGSGRGPTAFDADSYQSGGEEKIIPIENPLNCEVLVANQRMLPSLGSGYRQSLDMRTGVLSTEWRQRASGHEVTIRSTVALTKSRTVEQNFSLSAGENVIVKFRSRASGRIAGTEILGQFGTKKLKIESSVSGGLSGLWNKHAEWLEYSATTDSGAVSFQRTLTIGDAQSPNDRQVSDIEIDGPLEDQQAVRSFLFYLTSALSPGNSYSVPPYGLSSDIYSGHVFWDADVWVLPAMCFLDPPRAKSVVDYRVRTIPGAQENYRQWMASERPTANGQLGPGKEGSWGPPGMKFAWESSVTGRETMFGPSTFEHHITGSVAWAARYAESVGLLDSSAASDIVRGSAHFYSNRIEKVGEQFELRDTMSPDEFHIGDNDLYTNILAQKVLDDAIWWKAPSSQRGQLKLKIPRDEKSLLTYDSDELKSYKQAAAVLAIYPLQFPEAEKQARTMMDRFADKVTKNGPAMSESIHATIWARLGETDKAYATWHRGWKPFTNHPLLLFSEKRSRANTYFVTGAAGCLQTVLYGFLGFRIDSRKEPGAAWSTPLLGGNWLSIKPNLPKEWKKVTLKNFTVLGKRFTLTVDHNRVQVTQGDF